LVSSPERSAFWLIVALAGATFWLTPHPPMADLPQHAGQIALWRDLVLGNSKWQAWFSVNYLTPYLVGNCIALLLSFALPVTAALKLVLTLSYLGFVGACVLLRRWMGGDSRLDWLFVPGFFGLAYAYGFFPFLVGLPVGVLFIALAWRYAERPAVGSGVRLGLAGVMLFFSHGLVFVLANLIGVALLALRWRSIATLLTGVVPYAVFGLLAAIYFAALRLRGASLMSADRLEPSWPGPMSTLKHLLAFPIGVPSADLVLLPLVPLLLAVPVLLGYRPNWRNLPAMAPLALLLVWCFAVPDAFLDTWFIGSRFAALLLPFYALALRPPAAVRPAWMALALPALSLAFLAIHVERLMAFNRESASFDEVLAAAEPGERARYVVEDIASAATRNLMAYVHFPAWYQVEKAGLVDCNFANFAQAVVRYREGTVLPNEYRYYFVRNGRTVPATSLPPGACQPFLRKRAGTWSLFESTTC
jgi:hypothetical protein